MATSIPDSYTTYTDAKGSRCTSCCPCYGNPPAPRYNDCGDQGYGQMDGLYGITCYSACNCDINPPAPKYISCGYTELGSMLTLDGGTCYRACVCDQEQYSCMDVSNLPSGVDAQTVANWQCMDFGYYGNIPYGSPPAVLGTPDSGAPGTVCYHCQGGYNCETYCPDGFHLETAYGIYGEPHPDCVCRPDAPYNLSLIHI